MKLITYEGYNITIDPVALTLRPFRALWEKDNSKNKEAALRQLGWIYFMYDPRSDYQYIIDEQDRHEAICEGEGISKTWKPDRYVLQAAEYYKKFIPTAALLLEDTRAAVDKLRKKLRDIDLDAVDDNNKPIYTLNVITNTIKQVPSLVKELDEAERQISSEMIQSDKVRGASSKNVYEEL